MTPPRICCPFCERDEQTRLVARVGSQILTAQWHCGACGSYFEVIREEFDPPAPSRPTEG